ncbi:MAG: hypothetical protein HEQ35_20835 [Gloeotrichia echinulata IR180]|jgi:hypothetical protein|nr:hypothetical protein [Gloeotrichia echinulata DEX184]MCM0594485.1 hypothetical protein [Gloeotrichia echinulata DEX184]
MKIGWTPKSLRAFKRLIRKNPNLRPLIEQTLRQLGEDPFHPSLHTLVNKNIPASNAKNIL